MNEFNGVLLVGEAPGAYEEAQGVAFVGPAGKMLDKLLASAGIDRDCCVLTNVFHVRPNDNKVHEFFTAKKDEGAFVKHPRGPTYLRKTYAPELGRLAQEIEMIGTNLKVIVALGGVALWALTGKNGISAHRGLVSTFTFGGPGAWSEKHSCMLVPTFHPSYILHTNSTVATVTVVKDLALARSFIEAPEK